MQGKPETRFDERSTGTFGPQVPQVEMLLFCVFCFSQFFLSQMFEASKQQGTIFFAGEKLTPPQKNLTSFLAPETEGVLTPQMEGRLGVIPNLVAKPSSFRDAIFSFLLGRITISRGNEM